MMSKSLNYAYPQKFAEGGEVQVTDLSGLKQEPLGNDMVLVKFQDGSYGKTQKALFQAAESLGAPMGSQKDFANWHLNEWAPKVVSDPAFIAAHDKFNTDQISYNQAVMDSDPQYAKNRLAFVQTHAPNNAAAISAAEELVATGNYASAISPAATDSNASAPLNYLGAGASLVEKDGQMVSSDALKALQMAVGLQEQDMRYDADQDGRLGASDALLFEKYAQMSDYDDASGFMSDFYGEQPAQKTFPGGEPTYTTMAIGEEDGGGLIEPDPPRPPNPFLDLELPIATTMAMGEEDGGMPFLPPGREAPIVTTMAMGEEDGGGGTILPPPPTDILPPSPVAPPAPVNPIFTPAPPPPVDTTPVQGRTYGAYSGTPMGPTNSIQPFTPYMPPQPTQGPDLQSLITDTDFYANMSGPRTSVFQRS